MTKCKGGCQMRAGGKTCKKCGCDMEDEEYEKGEKEMRSGGMACMKCGGKMHKSGGTVSSCMKCGGGKYTFGGKVNWSKKKVTSNSSEKYGSGGMIKRADGSYSQRGLWDNIRANAGSGKEPTKQMLEQEKKIKQKMAVGGTVDTGCPPGQYKNFRGECVDYPSPETNANNISLTRDSDELLKAYQNKYNAYMSTQNLINALKNKNASYGDVMNLQRINLGMEGDFEGDWLQDYYPGLRNLHSVKAKIFKKPDVYVPPMPVGEVEEMMNSFAMERYKKEEEEKQKNLDKEYEKYNQDFMKRMDKEMEKEFANRPQEPDIYSSMRMVGFSPEDALALHKLKGYGLEHNNMQYMDLDYDLKEKLRRIKNGEKFVPMNIMVEGHHQFTPSPEELEKMNSNSGYKQEWANEQMQSRYGQDWRKNFGKKPGYNASFRPQSPYRPYRVGGTVTFGNAISSMKKYLYGGEIDNTAMTTDAEMPLSKGAYDVPEPTYDASVVSNESPMQVTDNVTQGTEQLGYKEIVQSFQKKNIDKSLPNWGYAKQEQIKLNELIRKDISTGNAKMDLLVEDDIIGDNTLRAMRAYEANGQYTRPEGFKDKWLAEYKKQWEEMQATGKSKANVPKDNNIIDQPKKSESKTMLDEFYNYFNPYGQKKKDMPVGYGTVLRPEEPKVKSKAAKYSAEKLTQKSGGWPKASLLLEGGIEVSTNDLKRKDFDTYFPIPGASKPGSKGVRATGRDNNKSFFDAVEKAQSKRKDGTSNNTSLQLIDKLLSSSKKAIVIPKGEDKYGREIKDIYLQDPFYPDKYHALDSLGVVEGEAIFGMDIEPKVGSLTKRQEEITNIARKKGGYKYDQSPYNYRKSKRY